MGAAASNENASDELDKVALRTSKRVGKIPVTGRFHDGRSLEDDYKPAVHQVVGKGMNGSVYKAQSLSTKAWYAVKDFRLQHLEAEQLEDLEAECEIFLSMDHPHVARLTDVYKNSEKLSLVMELMEGGELFDRISKRKTYSEKDAADTAYQMLLAVNYIHSHGIVHRDIKLENFLYEKKDTDHLKLIDFGFGKLWDHTIKMKLSCGTINYVAPEVLEKSYTDKCDLWSLGVVVYILLLGTMPFQGSEQGAIMRNIKKGNFNKKRFGSLSTEAQEFVSKLLVIDPRKRLSAPDALQQRFIKERSELSFKASKTEADQDTVEALVEFSKVSKFRRACMSAMAWSLTNDERSKLREAFLAMDKTNSGTITLGEFKTVVQKMKHLSREETQEVFANLHESCTEEIAYSDFLAAMVNTRINLHTDLLRTTFNRFDADHNGYIDVQELKAALGDTYEGQDVASMMKEADLDNDGRISFEEFMKYAKKGEADNNKVAGLATHLIDKEKQREKKANGGFLVRMKACIPCL